MFHGRCWVARVRGQSELFVDDGDASSWAVLAGDFVAVWDGDVQPGAGVGLSFHEESDARRRGVEEVSDFSGVFGEGPLIEEDAVEPDGCAVGLLGGERSWRVCVAEGAV